MGAAMHGISKSFLLGTLVARNEWQSMNVVGPEAPGQTTEHFISLRSNAMKPFSMKSLLIAMFAAGALGAGSVSAAYIAYGAEEKDKDKDKETRDYMDMRDSLQLSGMHEKDEEKDEKDEDKDRPQRGESGLQLGQAAPGGEQEEEKDEDKDRPQRGEASIG
jgi:hypothetical protein